MIAMRTMAVAALSAGLLVGCADMDRRDQRLLSGAAIGTAGGAAIGAIGGNAPLGAVLGAGAGLAGGYLVNEHEEARRRSYYQGYDDGRYYGRRGRGRY